jgi:MatE.
MISLAYGQGNYVLVRKRVSSIYVLSLIIGCVLLLAIFPFATQFLKLAGTPDDLIREGVSYFKGRASNHGMNYFLIMFTYL